MGEFESVLREIESIFSITKSREFRYRIFRLPYGYDDEYAPWVAQRIGAEINLLSSRRFDSQAEAMEWVSHLLNLLV